MTTTMPARRKKQRGGPDGDHQDIILFLLEKPVSDIQPRDADADAAARIARDAVAAIEAGDRVDASAVLLLIHRYAHDDDDAAGAALATALGALVDAALDPT